MESVKIGGISIPFWDLVTLLMKVALAAIPAVLLLVGSVAGIIGLLSAII